MIILITVLVICALVAVYAVTANYLEARAGGKAELLKARNAELKNSQAQLRIATKALRNIANGTSGLPVLDATNALDDIERREDKELS